MVFRCGRLRGLHHGNRGRADADVRRQFRLRHVIARQQVSANGKSFGRCGLFRLLLRFGPLEIFAIDGGHHMNQPLRVFGLFDCCVGRKDGRAINRFRDRDRTNNFVVSLFHGPLPRCNIQHQLDRSQYFLPTLSLKLVGAGVEKGQIADRLDPLVNGQPVLAEVDGKIHRGKQFRRV